MAVDPAGRIVTERAGWSLDWEVLTGERRVVPSEEAALHQGTATGGGPVPVGLETSLHVGDGAIRQTVYVCLAPGAGACALGALEIRNATSVPVAVTLSFRPGDFWRPDGLWNLQVDEAGVAVNGSPALWWEHPPADMHAAPDLVAASDPPDRPAPPTSGRVRSRRGRAGARLTWPVAHGSSLRVMLPLQTADGAPPAPASVPTLEQVSRGWDVHTARGLQVGGLAGGRTGSVTAAAVRRLLALDAGAATVGGVDGLLSPADRALVAVALAAAGYPQRAAEIVTVRAARNPGALGRIARQEAARHMQPWGEGAAAVGAMVAGAGVGGGWCSDRSGDDPLSRAAFLVGLRDVLVAESADRVDLLAGIGNLGELAGMRPPIEVHGLGTGRGMLSFAVRWHDATPALLWELTPPRNRLESWAAALVDGAGGDGADPPLRLTASGLASTWSADALAGEALLRPSR